MKYQVFDVSVPRQDTKIRYVTVLIQEGDAKTFEANKDNPNYLQFLTDAQLTDAKVKKLTPDVWYDFPTPVEEVVPVIEEVVEAV